MTDPDRLVFERAREKLDTDPGSLTANDIGALGGVYGHPVLWQRAIDARQKALTPAPAPASAPPRPRLNVEKMASAVVDIMKTALAPRDVQLKALESRQEKLEAENRELRDRLLLLEGAMAARRDFDRVPAR